MCPAHLKERSMIIIDGSAGEGGGQIFRTSLSLAICLGKAVTIKNIRAKRNKPGLLRQHLTCLRAAKEICNAEVLGDEIGADLVEFIPGEVKAGSYRFSIGTAGSTSLVLQTILLPLMFADGPSEVLIEGGTHNKGAPSYEFLQHCFLPAMQKMGYRFDVELCDYGFYPAGGGAIRVKVYPAENLQALDLCERGDLLNKQVTAIAAKLPKHVLQREVAVFENDRAWGDAELQVKNVGSVGPGNLVSLLLHFEKHVEVFDCVGEVNLSAEKVAKRVLNDAQCYLKKQAVVGEYLADQLLLPMLLAKGGKFITHDLSQHMLTNIETVQKISEQKIYTKEVKKNIWEIKI